MTGEQRRSEGCLLGLACGDALGRPVEFETAGSIRERHGRVTEMLGWGTHGKPPGTVTDDTEMALCIAESLVAEGGFDPADVADRFVDWLDSGPFDVGLMTRDAVRRIARGTPHDEAGRRVWESRPEGQNAGNGSVMRCAPHAVRYRHDDRLGEVSRQSSAITHYDPRCRWGCVLLNRTLAGLICDRPDPLGRALDRTDEAPEELRRAVEAVHGVVVGDRDRSSVEADLSTTGYVVDTLQAGLFCGLTADDPEAAVVDAVNRGGDTDTVGAVAGAVAGARFGPEMPDRWLAPIDETDRIRELARALATAGAD